MVEQTQDQDPMKAGRDRATSGMLRKELDMRLTAYLPAVVRRHLERQDMHMPLPMPTTHRTTVVSMFADVSGFTAMTESLAARGPVGAEDLAKHLNSYFEQLLRLVSSAGGDVFKFAGDAMLIFWPESKEDTMDSLLRRALQCALRIQSHLHEAELAQLARGVVLSVKVGVGIGEATIAHLGGESDGATTRIDECWKRVSEFFDGAPVQGHGSENDHDNSFHKVTGVNQPVKICSRRPSFTRHDALLHKRMKQYVSRAVWPYLDAHDEFWGSELRDVTVLFINLGFSEQDLAQMLGAKELQRLQDAFANVQKCVYDYEGTINKFLVDDKGSTVIAAFGLPPVTHENDPIRGILASLAICAKLGNIGLKASVGITTARLMQRAKTEGGGVITDTPTKTYTHDVLHFEKRPEIMVKGKNESIKIHRPYPRMSILLDYHLSSTVPQSAMLSSVRDVQRRLSLRADRQRLPAEELVESESFVEKIREGASPNKTLVRYAPLLNVILDTDFDAYPDMAIVGALENGAVDGEPPATNQNEEGTTEENQRQNEEEMRAHGYAFAESPDRTFNVKEQEIAAWFLGLLEMDLAQKEEARMTFSNSPYMDTRYESSDDSSEDGQESEGKPIDLDLSGILLLCALYAMSRERATVFCLDSAMHMDEKSWTLVAIIAKYFTNCLVVIGTRPPSLALGEHTESSSFRKQLRLLKHLKSSTCTSLDTFSSAEIGILSRQILQVPNIADSLLDILMSRSQGNPLFLHEIIAEMKEQQVLQVDEKKGIRKWELHVQEPWGDKYKAQFCFACHASFSKKDKVKEKDVDMNQDIEEAARKTKQRCQCCGYVFCAECTPKACQTKIPGKSNEPVRHCRTCYNLASSRRPSGSSHGIGSAAGAINDKRVRPKGRLRSIFQSGSSVDLSVSSSVLSKSPPVSNGATLTNRIALRPPRTVKSVLTTMLDQLTMSQRMLMKTASAVGPTFDKETLRGTCPIEAHLSRFDHDLEDLEQLAMIRRIDNFIGGVPASSKPSSVTSGAILASSQKAPPSNNVKVKFEFNHGFMRGVIREQMLRGQLDKLNTRIADFREQQQKEFRHKFFSKANESLSRPQQLNIAISPVDGGGFVQGIRRALTPTGTGMGNSRSPMVNDVRRRQLLSRRGSQPDVEPNHSHQGMVSNTTTGSSDSSPESSTTQAPQESEAEDPVVHPGDASTTSLLLTNSTFLTSTFIRLKSSQVFVKKYSSMFSHLKLKGLKNARQWKTRFAVLENSRLLLQYDEDDPAGTSSKPVPQHQGAPVGTLLSLKGAKVHACDPEIAAKVNCFQVEVSQWTKKGKMMKDERRSFIIGVESQEEVEDWVYMIRYAIESLESQPVSPQQ
ncbi:Adenylate cyclase [Phytophthora megakarya]|uniref:Adenylate cyclase n=1 Tax=Phytophthora megakarya TaxID=4795 RepID=A0A225VZ60_9STRA|nr:Adenylate cyclase [Phytophthora megakarya]